MLDILEQFTTEAVQKFIVSLCSEFFYYNSFIVSDAVGGECQRRGDGRHGPAA